MSRQQESNLYQNQHKMDVYYKNIKIGFLVRKIKNNVFSNWYGQCQGYWTAFIYFPKLDNTYEYKKFYNYIWNSNAIPKIAYSDNNVIGWYHDNPEDDYHYANLTEVIVEIWKIWKYISKFNNNF
ncbi:hypothetical protein H012_gp177 [Acanthamoeba polyphaga moumouvirus]|uniref:Uncharacterized protein n=2 Tax=Moumouvirus TaxID=3080801 RepID=L7RCF7_9VIRU|nr:hypothetical protein H012_gp177 [Acanthamoeba polyphaga moumouvirus]AEX62384.1 hypothetical protein mv_R179 [Moumouvirus Monve]AGC02274.1 hypothetical protein Moumou_00755 [Acanthamoeba polyphaga moumouvirus]